MGPLPFYLLATSFFYNVPLIVLLGIARNRIDRRVIRALVACGFAVATMFTLWRLEWFDVWRQGVPGVTYLLFYVPYVAGAAAIGWVIRIIVTRPGRLGVADASL